MSGALIEDPSDLVPQFWNLRRYDVPERLVIESEVGVGKDIAKSGHPLPIHFRMNLTDIRSNRLGGLSDDLKIPEHGIVGHLVCGKCREILSLRLSQDPVGCLDDVL